MDSNAGSSGGRKRRRPQPLILPDAATSRAEQDSPAASPHLAWTPSGANLSLELPVPPSPAPGEHFFPASAAPAAAWFAAHGAAGLDALMSPAPLALPPAPLALPPEPPRAASASAASSSASSGRPDLVDRVDAAWFREREPEVRAAARRLARRGVDASDALLSVSDASWFMAAMERANLARLGPAARTQVEASELRAKPKHRTAVVFSEDVHFIVGRDARFSLDMNDPRCARDPQKWIVHALCRELATCFPQSLAMKAGRSCIWSAMLARALFHLDRSGFAQARIAENDVQRSREATLFVGSYHISRSNFTKIFKRYLPQLAAEEEDDEEEADN